MLLPDRQTDTWTDTQNNRNKPLAGFNNNKINKKDKTVAETPAP